MALGSTTYQFLSHYSRSVGSKVRWRKRRCTLVLGEHFRPQYFDDRRSAHYKFMRRALGIDRKDPTLQKALSGEAVLGRATCQTVQKIIRKTEPSIVEALVQQGNAYLETHHIRNVGYTRNQGSRPSPETLTERTASRTICTLWELVHKNEASESFTAR